MATPHKTFVFLFALFFGWRVFGETCFEQNYRFDAPFIRETGTCSSIGLEGTTSFIRTGAPIVPHVLVNVKIPGNPTDLKIETVAENVSETLLPMIPDFGRIPHRVGEIHDDTKRDKPDHAIYSSNRFYPPRHAELVAVHRAGRQTIAVVRLFPVRVNPVTREMRAAGSISVRLTSATQSRQPRRLSPLASDNSWQYLLITTNTLVRSFEPLAEYKRNIGTKVQIKTVNDIYTGYPGADGPAKIRACIKDGYVNHGTEYVLLGGDVDSVPIRGAYGKVDITTDETIPTDVYYACLDGSWDGNGNGIYGEPDDGMNGTDVDLFSEVYVGRAPVDTPDEAAAFVQKTVRYLSIAHPTPGAVLFAAEYLYTQTVGDAVYYPQGGEQLDTLLPFFKGYDVRWLDDRPELAPQWDGEDITAELNRSPNIVVHNGHGQPFECMRLSCDRAARLPNDFPFNYHSIGCNAGRIDTTQECFAEALVNHAGGAATAVLNTRDGWFDPALPTLYSGEFQREYIRQAISEGQPVGKAMASAREALAGKVEDDGANDRPYRWIYYGSNLFGDPQLAIQATTRWHVLPMNGLTRNVLSYRDAAPQPFTFEVRNLSDGSAEWSVSTTLPFLVPSPRMGTLQGKGSASIDVSIVQTDLPASGTYAGEIRIHSSFSASPISFPVTIHVIVPPDCTDSIGAPDDTHLPFGPTTAGLAGKESTIRIVNRDSHTNLVVEKIKIDGRGVALTGTPTDLVCYDATSRHLYTLTADDEIVLTPISSTNFLGIGAIETIPERPSILYALDYFRNDILLISLQDGKILQTKTAPPPDHEAWCGLAYNTRDRGLYATSSDGVHTTLHRIDPTSLSIVKLARCPTEAAIIAIAFDDHGTLHGVDVNSDTLFRINPFTGTLTTTGRLGIDAEYAQGITFFPRNGKLIWASFTHDFVSQIRQVDTDTATGKILGTIPRNTSGKVPELEIAALPPVSSYQIGTALPIVLPPGESVTIPVTFRPDRIGDHDSVLTLHAKDDNAPFATFTLTGHAGKASTCPLAWLQENGLPLDGTADDLDSDDDGFTNAEEWRSGTDPNDRASRLHFTKCEHRNGQLVLSWPSTPGFVYTLQKNAQLAPTSFSTFSSVLATNTESSRTIPITRTNQFFRILIDPGD